VTVDWPSEAEPLEQLQLDLARRTPPPLRQALSDAVICGVFVCFPRGLDGTGRRGDPGWAGAALVRAGQVMASVAVAGAAGASYRAGLLAAREGPLLQSAVEALPRRPELLLVNATGRDHPRRAGLALHLGAALDLPSVGVTHRPLLASGSWPASARGTTSHLQLDGDVVGVWLRTREGNRPLVVHPAWRTDLESAVAVVLTACRGARTPLPIRAARQRAREARALAQGMALGPAGPLVG